MRGFPLFIAKALWMNSAYLSNQAGSQKKASLSVP
jgi:hypothetical protein